MFGPIVRYMRRLSYPTRFALIGAVFSAALIFLSYSLYHTTQNSVEFSTKERLGVSYLQHLPALIAALQDRRLLLSRPAADGEEAGVRWAKATARVESALLEVQQAQQRLETELKTRAAWNQIDRGWQTLRSTRGGVEQTGFNQHTVLIEQLLSLTVLACDTSNLTLDPDIDSYYLMDSVCVKLPTLMARVGESRGLSIVALSLKRLQPAQRIRLVELRPLVADASRGLLGNFARVFAANADLAPAFDTRLQSLAKRLPMVRTVVDQVLAENFETYPEQAYASGSGALEDIRVLHVMAAQHLDALLALRIQHLLGLRNLYIGAAALAWLACLYLFVALYISITRQLGGEPFYVEAVVKQIASGKLTTHITMREDDHDSLLASISEMQQALFEAIGELQTLSRFDALTGLANRRYFEERKDAEFRRALRDGLPLAVLMCDVDEFKRYNDSYGHRAGDICLQAIGKEMQARFQRAGDLAARIGGEEFAVIMPNTTPAHALELAERLRYAVWELVISHRSSSIADRVTISVGVAWMQGGESDDFDSLLQRADRALYQAKEAGRNRVLAAGSGME